MQVVPIKPTLKAREAKRLTVKYEELLSSFAFNFKLRRYTLGVQALAAAPSSLLMLATDSGLYLNCGLANGQGLTLVHFSAQRKQFLWDTLGA